MPMDGQVSTFWNFFPQRISDTGSYISIDEGNRRRLFRTYLWAKLYLAQHEAEQVRKKKWNSRGSNSGPSACEADAIPLHYYPSCLP